jgi:hypothetical protein
MIGPIILRPLTESPFRLVCGGRQLSQRVFGGGHFEISAPGSKGTSTHASKATTVVILSSKTAKRDPDNFLSPGYEYSLVFPTMKSVSVTETTKNTRACESCYRAKAKCISLSGRESDKCLR